MTAGCCGRAWRRTSRSLIPLRSNAARKRSCTTSRPVAGASRRQPRAFYCAGASRSDSWRRAMWPSNALTGRLKLKWPIIQAPMGSASTPALAAAVTNAGGLGGLGMWGRTAEQAARRIAGFRQQSGGSLNVNYPIWPDPRCAPERSEAMRQHLQLRYDAHGLGAVPEPKGEGSDVGPGPVGLLLGN